MINQLFNPNGPLWLVEDGEDKDIVISTRVRFVRNIAGYFFPRRSRAAELKEIREKVEDAASGLPIGITLRMNELTNSDRDFLRERQIFISNIPSAKSGSILISNNEDFYISINGDNHIYLVHMGSGAELYSVYRQAYETINLLSGKLEFARDKKWGYLTSSITDVGTGLRIGANFHLWATSISGRLNQLESVLKSNSMGIRGFFTYGAEVLGYMFHIFTIKTLGISEDEIYEWARNTIQHIIRIERDARAEIIEKARFQLEDRVSRALGVLRYSHLIGTHEALSLLLSIKMGFDTNLLTGADIKQILQLLLLVQPAHIEQIYNPDQSNPASFDITRAEIIKDKLSNVELA